MCIILPDLVFRLFYSQYNPTHWYCLVFCILNLSLNACIFLFSFQMTSWTMRIFAQYVGILLNFQNCCHVNIRSAYHVFMNSQKVYKTSPTWFVLYVGSHVTFLRKDSRIFLQIIVFQLKKLQNIVKSVRSQFVRKCALRVIHFCA